MRSVRSQFLSLSEEVADALAEGRAVVALESTIVAHGMPWPDNRDTARQTERLVRQNGAVPATVALLDGQALIGLNDEQLERIARPGEVLKISRRDVPYALSKKLPGATTVAATMLFAQMAGVRVFATGGIGGVHREAARTLDVSADLEELARTSVAVVCAGAKSLLDLALTLERLETLGVPVIGYGTDEFPAFYSRSSGLPAPMRLDTPDEVADFLRVKWAVGLEGGAIVANPIPEADQMAYQEVEIATQKALLEAARQKIGGKKLTPFLLDFIRQQTGGKSLAANVKLVHHNARLAAQIADRLAHVEAKNT